MNVRDGKTLPSDEPPAESESRRPIGAIFVELGFITSAQLDAALVIQRQTGARIGEILVEQGSLTRLDLASALAERWEPRRPDLDRGDAIPSPQDTESPAVGLGSSGDDRAAIAELEPRLMTAEERLEAPVPAARQRRGLVRRAGRETEDALRAQVDGIARRLAAVEGSEATLVELRRLVDDLAAERAGDTVETGARLAAAEAQVAALVGEIAGLRAELVAHSDRRAADDFGEQLLELAARVDREAREGHDRMTGLTEELRAEAIQARVDAEQTATLLHAENGSLAARIDELLGLRHADGRAARVVGEQFEARLDGLAVSQTALAEAVHTTAQAAEAEQSLRDELERIALAVEALGRRLDEQAELGDEQARAVEYALREGLAGLGKRLTGPDAKYTAHGKRLRRSIERLGAAVVEADARLARQIPVSEAEGYVAFVPMDEGYRLVELRGAPPALGATAEVEGCDGQLVVTRYGRSPLPLDGRPCAYLARA